MATRVATAVVEITTDTRPLKAGLEQAKKDGKALGTELSKSFQTTEKDARALSTALSQVFGSQLETRAKATTVAIQQIGGATKLTDAEARKHLATLNEWIAKADKLGKEVPADILKTRDALVRTNAEIGKGPSQVSSFTSSLKGMAATMGIAFSVGAVKSWVSSTLAAAGQIQDLSQKLGVSAEAVQEWGHAARQSGASIETVDKAVTFMNKTLGEGSKGTIAALKQAGLQFDQIRKMRPEEAFNAIANAVGGIEDPMKRMQVQQELLGRGAADLLPAMIEGWNKLRAGADKMTNDTIDRLAAAEDAWERFGNKVTVVSGEMLATMMRDADKAQTTWTGMLATILKYNPVLPIFGGALGGIQINTPSSAPSGPTKPPESDADRKARITAKMEELRLDNERAAAAAKATRGAAEHADMLRRIAAARIPLTATQQLEIEQLLQLGIGHNDIAKKLGVSEIAVRKFDDANKALAKTLDALTKQQIPPLKRGYLDLLAIVTRIEQIPLLQRDTLTQLRTGGLNDLLGVDPATGRAKNVVEQLRTTDFMAWVKMVGVIEETPPKVAKVTLEVGKLAAEIAQLGQVSGGAFGAMLQQLSTVLSAIDAARKSAKAFGDGLASFKKGFNLEGILGMTSGLLGMASAAIAAGKALAGLLGLGANDTKKARESFAQELGLRDTTALWDHLRKNLPPELAESLRNRALNVIGKKDTAANERWMQDVLDALENHKSKEEEVAQAAKDSADVQVAAHRQVLEGLQATMDALDQEYQQLWNTIKDEAPEEEMGVIERQARERMATIEEERKQVQQQIEQTTATLEASLARVEAAVSSLADALGALGDREIRIPVSFDVDDMPTAPASSAARGGLVTPFGVQYLAQEACCAPSSVRRGRIPSLPC